MSWDLTTLQEVTSKIGDGLHGTPKYDEHGEYYFINGNNLHQGQIKIKDDTKKININEYQKIKKELNNQTVFVSINGTLGNVALYNEEKIALGKSACYLNVNQNVEKLFIRYVLENETFQSYAERFATGATIKNLGLKAVRNYEFLLPSLQTQKRIADILSAYDDLIENNLRRIKLLEQAAQNIYKEWFVHMRFPGHESTPINEETGLPEGWEYSNFSDIAKFSQGLQVPTDKQYSSKKEGQKRFIRIVDVTQGEQEPRYIDCLNSKYEVKKSDLFMIRYGSPKVVMGYSGVIANNFFRIQILKGVKMNNNYLYSFLNRDEITKKLMNYSSSATMPAISFKRISNMQILYPDFEIQEKYSKILDANWALIFNLTKSNQKLKSARDILLPRLMNRTIEA
jgi:type I restriction enzyme, S subunit